MSRKSTYKPEYAQQIIVHMAQGLSFESFAATIDAHHDQLRQWAKLHPDFDYARQIGSSKSLLFWEKMGIAGAMGKVKNFNPTAWIFNMKNRFQWRDMGQVTSDGNITIKLAYKNPKGAVDGREEDETKEIGPEDSLQEPTVVSPRPIQALGDKRKVKQIVEKGDSSD